jgi:hypothetical protein
VANSEQFLTSPYPLTLVEGSNSFVSNWCDKRSSTTFGCSVVFYGALAADGYCTLEVSNAPMQSGQSYGQPANGADDRTTLASSQTTATLNTLTGNYQVTWFIYDCPAHFFRVRYTETSQVSGLSVNVYASVPFESP